MKMAVGPVSQYVGVHRPGKKKQFTAYGIILGCYKNSSITFIPSLGTLAMKNKVATHRRTDANSG